MKNLDICLTPDLIHLYDLDGKTAVVVDILRASSCITTALASGVDHIMPFASLEECRDQRKNGYMIAGERGGQQVPDFDLGNSPLSYMEGNFNGSKIAMTTTNGTVAINKSQKASTILIGSFLNISRTVRELLDDQNDVLIVCAGWKGKVNLEDTLYAGAVADRLSATHHFSDDAVLIARDLYQKHQDDLLDLVKRSSHAKRLAKFNVLEDIEFCLAIDKFEVNPVYKNGRIVAG